MMQGTPVEFMRVDEDGNVGFYLTAGGSSGTNMEEWSLSDGPSQIVFYVVDDRGAVEDRRNLELGEEARADMRAYGSMIIVLSLLLVFYVCFKWWAWHRRENKPYDIGNVAKEEW